MNQDSQAPGSRRTIDIQSINPKLISSHSKIEKNRRARLAQKFNELEEVCSRLNPALAIHSRSKEFILQTATHLLNQYAEMKGGLRSRYSGDENRSSLNAVQQPPSPVFGSSSSNSIIQASSFGLPSSSSSMLSSAADRDSNSTSSFSFSVSPSAFPPCSMSVETPYNPSFASHFMSGVEVFPQTSSSSFQAPFMFAEPSQPSQVSPPSSSESFLLGATQRDSMQQPASVNRRSYSRKDTTPYPRFAQDVGAQQPVSRMLRAPPSPATLDRAKLIDQYLAYLRQFPSIQAEDALKSAMDQGSALAPPHKPE